MKQNTHFENVIKYGIKGKAAGSLLSVLLAAVMVFTGASLPDGSFTDFTAYAATGAGSVHYIAVASDRHDSTAAIPAAMSGMPSSVEYVCLDGDMAFDPGKNRPRRPAGDQGSIVPGSGAAPDGGQGRRPAMTQEAYNTSTVLKEVQSVFPSLGRGNVSIVYGSHDANATDDAGIMKCADTSLMPSEKDSNAISAGQSGQIFEGPDGSDADDLPDYYIYGVSYFDMKKASNTATEGRGESAKEVTYEGDAGGELSAAAFRSWVDGLGDPDVPIIVIGHVPIHAQRNDNLGASYWDAALYYAATGKEKTTFTFDQSYSDQDFSGTDIVRNVVYVHGHNHTTEKGADGAAVEYSYVPGDRISVQGKGREGTSNNIATLKYSYITGGYLRDNHTATLITVDGKDLSFEKYSGYIVRFDTQGGSTIEDLAAGTDGYVSMPETDPTRDGYDFTGWYKEDTCENLWDFDSDTVTGDMTLYAGWKEHEEPAEPAKPVKPTDETGPAEPATNSDSSDSSQSSQAAIAYSAAAYSYDASVSALRAAAWKKAIRLRWKKRKGASAYQIQYATNRKMKNAVTIKVSCKKTAYTITKLKRNRKYYVRIRPLKNKYGNTYKGRWSKKRVVRTR